MGKTAILLSVKPKYAQKIFNGEKNIELRRIKPKRMRTGSLVVVYASSPIKMILGIFCVSRIETIDLKNLNSSIPNRACVSNEEAKEYFSGKDEGYAIHIGSRWLIKNKMKRFLYVKNIINSPPQSFRYINIEDLDLTGELTDFF